MAVCGRFDADGTKCARHTDREDGWCGTCAGFHTDTPPSRVPPRASTRKAGRAPQPPLTNDDVLDLRVSRSAIDRYRKLHGGTPAEAEAALRSMAEDFVQAGVTVYRTEGMRDLMMMKRGFTLFFSQDRSTLTGYTTVHVDRTWGQIVAGVASRVTAERDERQRQRLEAEYPSLGRLTPCGPALPDPEAVRGLDPASVHVPPWAVKKFALRYAPWWHPGDDPTAVHERLRAELASAMRTSRPSWGAQPDARPPATVLQLDEGHRIWVLREDGMRVLTILTPDAGKGTGDAEPPVTSDGGT